MHALNIARLTLQPHYKTLCRVSWTRSIDALARSRIEARSDRGTLNITGIQSYNVGKGLNLKFQTVDWDL